MERAIKQVRGNGTRVLATFEDPNCGYCKRLAKDLLKLDNVTGATFLYPILSEDSIKKSKQIWCAADRTKAWNDWMIEGRVPAGRMILILRRLRRIRNSASPEYQWHPDHVLCRW